MSHIEEGTTTLRLTSLAAVMRTGNREAVLQHPCLALLRQAVTLVAQEHKGAVHETYLDYNWQPQPTNTHLALRIPGALPRGFGLKVELDTGALVFTGDPWRINRAWYQQLQQRIVQNYVVLAHCAALQRMQCQVSTQEQQGQVVITGVFHG